MRRLLFYLLLFIALDGCIDPLPLKLKSDTGKLVVDGMITQEPGPYQVKLFYSNTLDNNQKKVVYETRASVWILSSTGESEKLTQNEGGIYQTSVNGLRGEIGKSYTIRIVTFDGKEYISAPQLLQDGGIVSNVYWSFQENAINADDPFATHDVLNIYADSQGQPGQENLFRWRWSGTYTARSYPEFHLNLLGRPDPRPCSGYIAAGSGIVKVGECTCCICYAHEYSPSALVSDNAHSDAQRFNKVNITKIPANGMRFFERYHIEVEQLRLSEQVYKFWDLLQEQQQAQGSIFQPNAVQIKGNVHLASDERETLLGIFAVAGVSRNSVFIERSELPKVPGPIGELGEDCRLVFENAVTEKPSFW